MRHVGKTYVLGTGVFMFLFINFIACGSKLYQVSMDHDLDDHKVPQEAKDPNSTTFGIHAVNGWQQLPISYRFASDMNDMQKSALMKAMKTWEKVTGASLFKYSGIDQSHTGDSFKDLYSSLGDNINGNYLDNNWEKTAKPRVVLATTIWDNVGGDTSQISTADIRFNNEYYLIGDSLLLSATNEKEVVDMESLALHELGHFLGLTHIEGDVDALSIMNPQLFIGEGLTARKLSRGDIERIQTIYGCKDAACDVDGLIHEMELSQAETSSGQPEGTAERN